MNLELNIFICLSRGKLEAKPIPDLKQNIKKKK